ncbi:MAG: hypothetical protein ABIL58_23455 [Pseudomonadota bacterium]
MKILQYGDVHCCNENLDEVKRCTTHMLDVAHDELPDLIIDGGDIFESRHTRADSPAFKYAEWLVGELADIAPVARVIGTWSHDGRISEVFDNIGSKFDIRTAVDGPMQVFLTPNGSLRTAEGLRASSSGLASPIYPAAVVSLVPAFTKEHIIAHLSGGIAETDQTIAEAMSAIFAGLGATAASYPHAPHILVGHWNTKGSLISPTQMIPGTDIELSRDQMMMADPDLVCLGHIHKAQVFGTLPIFYSGSTQINTWGELDAKGFWMHEVAEYGWTHKFIQTPTRRRIMVVKDFTSSGLDDPAAALAEKLPAADDDILTGSMVQARVKYYRDDAVKLGDETIRSAFPGAEVDIARHPVDRENTRSTKLTEVDRLRDKIQARAELTGEPIPDGALAAADLLEDHDAETVIEAVEAIADNMTPNMAQMVARASREAA